MITEPMDVLRSYEVRKNKKQKQAFRDAVQAYASGLGYSVTVEKGSPGVKNVVIGDPSKAKYLVTAHYDTPAGMILPNLITPCNLFAFLIYQIFVCFVVFLPSIAVFLGLSWLMPESGLPGVLAYILMWVCLILMMAGPANPHTANDNTSGVVTVLEMARTMPENHRDKVAFVLFDLEEMGLLGSSAYRKAHKAETDNQIILNLDCVGDGNDLVLFPTNKLAKDREKMLHLCKCVGRFGTKTISVVHKGFRYYPSDQKNFPYGVGIAAFRRKKGVGLYCDKIHTAKDTVLDETNVNLLRAALSSYISPDE